MLRLSSPMTVFYKRVFPVFWFGFLSLVLVGGVFGTLLAHQRDLWPMLVAPIFMMGIGVVLFRALLFDLVDEVWLEGSQLVVKQRGESSRIDLANVINVDSSTMTNPPRITLMLRAKSSRLGKTVAFIPSGSRGLLTAFKPNPIAIDLIHRIDALRQRPA
ncbi:MAG TPA: hypothetical protein VFG49_06865 [Dyella sp.]|uniref:hypothetical protein n=1 Tax=Dyella sp. TaxID=1869338 RepID=UPI002D788214|nr:hypothetical protein [Dyella sp.]HET6553247.1 hypothetical protein [Dyella sp.]